jgi:hypothetical protein
MTYLSIECLIRQQEIQRHFDETDPCINQNFKCQNLLDPVHGHDSAGTVQGN